MGLEDDIGKLARIPAFAVIEPEALRLIAFSAESRILRAGDVLFRRDEISNDGFVVLAGSIAWSRIREEQGRPWQRPVQAAIGLVFAYIGLNLLITQRADAALRNWADKRRIDAIFASPPPIQFWRRGLVWREGDCYRWGSYDPLGGGFQAVTNCRPNQLGDPLVREALRRDPRLRAFLRWSVLPLAEIKRSRCSATVSIGDARYQDFGSRSRLMRETVVPTVGPGC
jgi:inner membrane protein